MIAEKVIAKVVKRSSYDTTGCDYTPAAAVTSKGELVVSMVPNNPARPEWPGCIVVRFTPHETDIIRRALEGSCR